jgi:hypothetical protein
LVSFYSNGEALDPSLHISTTLKPSHDPATTSLKMSSEAAPISPERFAAALRDLPLSSLHLKAAELRNSIAHLDYSNEQLKPFAEGTAPEQTGPDPDCVEAIKENEVVIQRMLERIELLKAEVESRGAVWLDLSDPDAARQLEGEETEAGSEALVGESSGVGSDGRSEAWRDGTFTTGRIVGGEVVMDDVNGTTTNGASMHLTGTNGTAMSGTAINGTAVNGTATNGTRAGGRLDDESLRRAMEERMNVLADSGDEDEGLHL